MLVPGIWINKTDQPQPHAAAVLDQPSHFAGARTASDNQEVMIASEAITHPGDAGVRDGPPHQKQHEIDPADQQHVTATDIFATEQVQASVNDHQHDAELAHDVKNELDRIAQLQIAIEAGEVAHHGPYDEKGDQERDIMAEGIDSGLQIAAKKPEVPQGTAQQIRDPESDTRHPKVV